MFYNLNLRYIVNVSPPLDKILPEAATKNLVCHVSEFNMSAWIKCCTGNIDKKKLFLDYGFQITYAGKILNILNIKPNPFTNILKERDTRLSRLESGMVD